MHGSSLYRLLFLPSLPLLSSLFLSFLLSPSQINIIIVITKLKLKHFTMLSKAAAYFRSAISSLDRQIMKVALREQYSHCV